MRVMAAAIVRDGRLLLIGEQGVRKFPGGAVEAAETDEECLHREVLEEIGAEIVGTPKYLVDVEGPSPYSDEQEVHVRMYLVDMEGDPSPSGEVDELVWIGLGDYALIESLPFLTTQIFICVTRVLCEKGYL